MASLLPSRSQLVLVLAVSFALAAVACKIEVTGGGLGGDDGRVTGGAGNAGTGGNPQSSAALGEWASKQANPPPPGTSSSSGGPLFLNETLNVRIGNYGLSCYGDLPYSCNGQTTWEVTIGVPPAYMIQSTWSLSELPATASENGGGPGSECWGGGGSFNEGTITIESLTPLVVTLAGTMLLTAGSADGTYEVPICP